MKLERGCKLPDFPISTFQGEKQTIHQLLQKSSQTVFWVLRYIGCPSCQYDLHLLAQHYGAFEALGTQVVVVLQSVTETLKNHYGQQMPPFTIICDPEMHIYEDLEVPAASSKETYFPTDEEGLARLAEKREKRDTAGFVHGEYEGNELQLPAVFLLEKDGTVQYAHYAKDSMDMPTIDELLAICKDVG